MSRVASTQSDLFAPSSAPAAPPPDPLDELNAMLQRLRAAERMPWPDAAAATVDELRALGLAHAAGAPGAALARSVLAETERLLAAADAAAQPMA